MNCTLNLMSIYTTSIGLNTILWFFLPRLMHRVDLYAVIYGNKHIIYLDNFILLWAMLCSAVVRQLFWVLIKHAYIYICKLLNETAKGNLIKHFNPIEYIQCPEFSTTPAVFIRGTMYIYIQWTLGCRTNPKSNKSELDNNNREKYA